MKEKREILKHDINFNRIPILLNHNSLEQIGCTSLEEGKLTIQLVEALPESKVFAIFGNIGMRVIDFHIIDDEIFIKKFHIYEWSDISTPVKEALRVKVYEVIKDVGVINEEENKPILLPDKFCKHLAAKIIDKLIKYI